MLAANIAHNSISFCQTLDHYRRTARRQSAAHRHAASATTATSAKRWPKSTTCLPASTKYDDETTASTGCSTSERKSASFATTSTSSAAEPPSCPAICTIGSASWRRCSHAVPLGDSPGLDDDRPGHDAARCRRAALPQMDRPTAGDARRRLARSGRRQVRSPHSSRIERRNARAGRGDERHDGPLPGNSRRPRLPGPRADEASRPQRATGQRRLSGGRRGPRNQQSAGVDRHVQRVARRPAEPSCSKPSATRTPPTATSFATTST